VADTTCNIADPKTPAEAKFSLRLAVAMALLGLDTGDLQLYSTQTLARPDVQRLRRITGVELVEGWSTMDSEVVVTLGNGSQIGQRVDTGVPCSDIAWQGERLAAKFTRLTAPLLGATGTGQLAQAIDGFEQWPVRRLLDLCDIAPQGQASRPASGGGSYEG
jgi:2-methylcitrate dehydratase PrpD